MILRIDDTDIERNTEASLNSIFEGLAVARTSAGTSRYRQFGAARPAQTTMADTIPPQRPHAYRDFTAASTDEGRKNIARRGSVAVSISRYVPDLSAEEKRSPRPPRVSRFVLALFPRAARSCPASFRFHDEVLWRAVENPPPDIEDFRASSRSKPARPTYPSRLLPPTTARPAPSGQHYPPARTTSPTHSSTCSSLKPPGGPVPERFAHSAVADRARWQPKLSKRPPWPPSSASTHLSRFRDFLPQAFVNFRLAPAGLVA